MWNLRALAALAVFQTVVHAHPSPGLDDVAPDTATGLNDDVSTLSLTRGPDPVQDAGDDEKLPKLQKYNLVPPQKFTLDQVHEANKSLTYAFLLQKFDEIDNSELLWNPDKKKDSRTLIEIKAIAKAWTDTSSPDRVHELMDEVFNGLDQETSDQAKELTQKMYDEIKAEVETALKNPVSIEIPAKSETADAEVKASKPKKTPEETAIEVKSSVEKANAFLNLFLILEKVLDECDIRYDGHLNWFKTALKPALASATEAQRKDIKKKFQDKEKERGWKTQKWGSTEADKLEDLLKGHKGQV